MTTPHLIFLGLGITIKILIPSIVRWLANDTYATAVLSIWYPFISTLLWFHSRCNTDTFDAGKIPSTSDKSKDELKALCKALGLKVSGNKPELQDRLQEHFLSSSKENDETGQVTTKNSAAEQSKRTPPSSPKPPSPEAYTNYWLRYWEVYGIVQAFGSFLRMMPVFGRFVARHPLFLAFTAEIKLIFFVWLFGMESLLGNTTEDAFLEEAKPMKLLNRHLNPILLQFTTAVSEAVSKESWKGFVHGKIEGFLDLAVMVRLLSKETKDWLLHVLDESRVLLLPSITLFMPSFVTQFGVSYVQYIVPSAKSTRAEGEANKLVYLQYWILHCIFSGVLTWLSSLLWWIPFSTHFIFVAWCNLNFPRTIAKYYAILETELVAFGLLKGDSRLAVQDTRTAQLFTAIANRLPTASLDGNENFTKADSESADAAQDHGASMTNEENDARKTPSASENVIYDENKNELLGSSKSENSSIRRRKQAFAELSSSSSSSSSENIQNNKKKTI